MAYTGECFCGGVKYKIEGALHRPRICHCSRCRKAFSAQGNAYAEVDPGDFSWIQGEELLTTFPADGNSGKRFCRVCGSTLCGVVDGRVHGVTLGTLNQDQGITLQAHIFVGSKPAWDTINDDVPQFEEFPPDW
ncbi:GFA family protein [Rhodospirillum sp. A1_3_36]|uniref:GFA family protein n=1 Tax=Rhodospirillum sp. A1_3_36 TaxID=3391666 RepID=UPI0039A50E63